jgi:hypothetical protein
MTIVIPNVGECTLLDKMLKLSDEDYTLKLYRTNTTLGDSTIVTDFTEANFTSYVSKSLTRANWGSAVVDSNIAKSTYSAELSWTCGVTGGVVYGYWIVGATSGNLLYAEAMGASRTLADGDIIKITPEFTFRTQVVCP